MAGIPAVPFEQDVLLNMNKIEIGHGSGGKLTRDLIENVFLKYLKSDELKTLEDAASIDLNHDRRIAVTTDSYVIRPLFFPQIIHPTDILVTDVPCNLQLVPESLDRFLICGYFRHY